MKSRADLDPAQALPSSKEEEEEAKESSDLDEEDGGEEKESKRKIEPMELEQGVSVDESVDDMESLLPGQNENRRSPGKDAPTYFRGWIKPQQVGNMKILFPEKYHENRSSWGVVGPQPFGPFCVWLILSAATHYIVKRAFDFGIGSVIICYIFYATSTFLLTDVSFRDPGICLDKHIPETASGDEARQWRWCDFCNVFQPPDGAHCPDCNVCIAGYDHHCVWMGTCIGKKNYKQFLKFNMSWLYYALYCFLWLGIIGTFIKDP